MYISWEKKLIGNPMEDKDSWRVSFLKTCPKAILIKRRGQECLKLLRMNSHNTLLHFAERCLAPMLSGVFWLKSGFWRVPGSEPPESTAEVGPFPLTGQSTFFRSNHGCPHLLTTPQRRVGGSHRLTRLPGPDWVPWVCDISMLSVNPHSAWSQIRKKQAQEPRAVSKGG